MGIAYIRSGEYKRVRSLLHKLKYTKALNSPRSSGQNYHLPQIEFDLFKNSSVNRCFFPHLIQFLSVVNSVMCCYFLFSRISLFAFAYVSTLCRNVCAWHALNKEKSTYLLTYLHTSNDPVYWTRKQKWDRVNSVNYMQEPVPAILEPERNSQS